MGADPSPLPAVQVQQNPVEPSVEAAAPLEFVLLSGSHQKCFLSQVVCVPGVAGQDQRGTVHAGKVLVGGLLDINASHGWQGLKVDEWRHNDGSKPAYFMRLVTKRIKYAAQVYLSDSRPLRPTQSMA